MRIKNMCLIYCCTFYSLISISCNTSPQDKISRRWIIADVYGDADDKQRFARNQEGNIREIEFTKEGAVLIYKNGVLDLKSLYTLAPDGQSLVINEVNSKEQLSFKIIKLTSTKLEYVVVGQLKDTLICTVKP
jgi:hypothetical protein